MGGCATPAKPGACFTAQRGHMVDTSGMKATEEVARYRGDVEASWLLLHGVYQAGEGTWTSCCRGHSTQFGQQTDCLRVAGTLHSRRRRRARGPVAGTQRGPARATAPVASDRVEILPARRGNCTRDHERRAPQSVRLVMVVHLGLLDLGIPPSTHAARSVSSATPRLNLLA